MARTKGSKNVKTLIKEMEATGIPFALPENPTRDEVMTLHKEVMAKVGNAVLETVPSTVPVITAVATNYTPEAKEFLNTAALRVKAMADKAGIEAPQRVYDTLTEILAQSTQEGMAAVLEKTLNKLEMHILALKATGKLPTSVTG